MTSSSCPTNCGCAGCRTGTALETPATVFNPPGQPALAFRVGTHGRFLSSMRARLSSPAYPALSALTVRSTDDPAIALLDSWAVLGDLLSFYSERIADEGYLRTATQDASIQMLGALVGYRPRPGVAGGTALAFTIDPPQNPDGDTVALLPAGTRAQSVPVPGSDSQYFEISDDLTARSSLNQLKVLTRLPYQLTAEQVRKRTQIYLAGTANNVKPGDQLLFVFSADKAAPPDQRVLLQVPGVWIDQANAITKVGLPGVEQPNLSDLLAKVQLLLGLDDEQPSPNPVPQFSALAARFNSEVLLATLNPAHAFTSPAALAAAAEQARQRALETAVLAQPYLAVSSWLGTWIDDLAGLRDQGLALEPPQPPAGGTPRGPADPALTGLAGIFAALHTTPNPPPPAARDLKLDPAALYALGSDLAPQLLAALDPQVSSGLYQAWQHTSVSAPPALQTLQAMRTVATPFGATAPLIANLDPHTGQVNGYTDWPLAGTKEVSLLLGYDSAGTAQKQADFTYIEGGPNFGTFDLPTAATTRQLGPMSVTLTSYPTPGTTPPGPHTPPALTPASEHAPASAQARTPESGAWHLHLPGHHEAAAAQSSPEADTQILPRTQPLAQVSEQGSGETPDAAPPAAHEAGLLVQYHTQFDGWSVFTGLPVADDGTTVSADGKIHVLITSAQGDTKEFHLAPGDKPATSLLDGISVAVSRAASGASAASVSVALTTPVSTPSKNRIWLDSVYDGIAVGSWVVINRPSKQTAAALAAGLVADAAPAGQVSRLTAAASAVTPDPSGSSLARVITRVKAVQVQARADFGITGKVTQLDLDDDWLDDTDTKLSQLRDTTVYARGEALNLATEPVPDDVQGATIQLAALYTGITPGRLVAVTGERTDIPDTPGVTGAELAMVAGVTQTVDPTRPGDTVRTVLTLAAPLAYTYRRDSVRIWGNVASATQGASRDDPIGSGDAAVENQTFKLWQAPLTWLAAGTTPSGAASTLQVRVNGVLWTEVDSFAGHGPSMRIYTTATAGDGKTLVTFGDGVTGARLPTGTENVRARYRVGLGRSGDVPAGQITQLTTRPLGVSAVTNPVAGTGGADADPPNLARSNIPLALTALDRLVSVPDYEDFARSYAGIGRASAQRLSDGSRQVVHLTVAGVDDSPLLPDNGLLASLHAALAEFGDPQLPVDVAVRELVLLIVALSVKLTPDAAWDLVEPVLRSTLTNLLSVSNRQLGQPAYASEVIAAAQAVPGVDYVDLQAFTGIPGSTTPLGLAALLSGLATPVTVVPSALASFDLVRHTVVADPDTGVVQTLSQIAAEYAISVDALLALNPGLQDVVLAIGESVVVFRGIRPAQLVVLSDAVPDTLILREIAS